MTCASHIPFPTRPHCPPCPQATAMEICFSHIANYLRVITSLTVQGDNEWLIGHSSLHHSVLPLPPSLIATCLTGCDGCCCPFSICIPPALLCSMCMFLEVTWNIRSGCKAGSVVKGTWLVFVTAMIPQASKCWRLVLPGNAQWACGVDCKWLTLLGNEPRMDTWNQRELLLYLHSLH